MNTKVNLCGIEIDNPVIPASGTFGFGKEFAELYDINCLGTFSFKGTTLDPRFGNPTPSIAEFTGGMLNAVGLQNPGVDHVIKHELPEMKEFFHKPVMANISGFSIDEYVEVAEKTARTADRRYEVAKRLYILGKSTILDLNASITEKDAARRSYISALKSYWSLYYGLRSMTGYDFERNQKIEENLPEI